MFRTRMTLFSALMIALLSGFLPGCKGSGQQQASHPATAPMQAAPIAAGSPPAAGPNQQAVAANLGPRQALPSQNWPVAGGPPATGIGPGGPATSPSWATRQAPPTDDALQGTCPVTGAELGSMGEPVPVTVRGKVVYVCCAGCVNKLLANPDRYLRADSSHDAAGYAAPHYGRSASTDGGGCCSSGASRSSARVASSICGGACCSE